MHTVRSLALLWTAFVSASVLSQTEKSITDDGLRLIKTSPTDPGQWVTEDEKITDFRAKGINFIDVTDIVDTHTIDRLANTNSTSAISRRPYPVTLSHQLEAMSLLDEISTDGPKSWLKSLTSFYNRYYRSVHGTEAAYWLVRLVNEISSPNSAIRVTQFRHSYNQPSIIVQIPGDSPDLVILGAHFDSTGGSPNARGPGADDNGSGVVVLLETLRVLVDQEFRPRNTIEFHFYSGEEGGLLGSGDIWRSYRSARKSVLAFVNTDQAGYSPSRKISVYDDFADTGLTNFVRRVIDGYIGDSTKDICGYGCSDHASAFMYGFPAAYVCDEPDATSTPFVHTDKDSYETVNFDTISRHIKFSIAFLVESNAFASIIQSPTQASP